MNTAFLYLGIFALVGVSGYLAFLLFKNKQRLKRYSKIISIEDETSALMSKAQKLKSSYEELSKRHNILSKDVKDLDDESILMEYGLYKPKYNLENSQEYKSRLEGIRAKQKEMIKSNKAMHCSTNWQIGGNKRAGEAMTKKIHKIALNAFNVECDNLILKVKYNNVDAIEERIYKLSDRIEKSLDKWGSNVVQGFISLKIEELHLVHEYQEKLYEEKEEQRLIKEQMREEEKARKEFEKAQRDAEKEEKQYQVALDKARKEADKASAEEKSKLEEQIKELEAKLTDAHSSKERALSMAQQTKRGHVYVISNIGSFGENVYKIGMTRRLEPMDRVKELGDASVPFTFDVHAMIFSENAPELEGELHKFFDSRRRNKVNLRKEFFDVSLDEIESFCKEKKIEIEFTKKAEAKEYWETQALKDKGEQEFKEKHDISDIDLDFDVDKKAA